MNILLTGVGGQGIVLASRLLAECAMKHDDSVKTAETLGMAQRGGSVVSHVRSGKFVNSPLLSFDSADLIIGFEIAETQRVLDYLAKDGKILINDYSIQIAKTPYDRNAIYDYLKSLPNEKTFVDGPAICEKCGLSKVLNVAILGTASKLGYIPYTIGELEDAVAKLVPERFIELNKKALEVGYNF